MADDLIARARCPLPPHDAPCPLDYVENTLRMATRIEQLQRELAQAEDRIHRLQGTGPYITTESWNNACAGLGTKV